MKRNFSILLVITAFMLIASVSAADISAFTPVKVYFFYGNGCPHCANVEASGILEKVQNFSNPVLVIKYEIYNNESSRELFNQYYDKFGVSQDARGVPLAVINCHGNLSYLKGDGPIINNLEQAVKECKDQQAKQITPSSQITLGAVILGGLVDSLNPCALGVLAFLMISLLKVGSAKRALRYGLLYSFVVLIVYMLSGFGIFKLIQSTTVTRTIYLGAGALVLFLGASQIFDVFFPGKFISLRIPVKAKPTIERIASKGTLPAVLLLAVIVSLFELPCTGGIYVGILTLMSVHKSFGLWYLLLYNLMFILPLVIVTFIIYKGTNPEKIQSWSQNEKGWMKLASGIVMLALGIYILVSAL